MDTSNILFICGGAFAGLETVIRDRSDKSGIGFSATLKSIKDSGEKELLLDAVEAEDLVKYGLIPEFVGRLPVITTLKELDEDALVAILQQPKNALTKQFQSLFKMEDIELEFRDDALRQIARKAMQRKIGARGLRAILENMLLDTMYELPTMEGVVKVVIDESVIASEGKPLLIYENDDASKKANSGSTS